MITPPLWSHGIKIVQLHPFQIQSSFDDYILFQEFYSMSDDHEDTVGRKRPAAFQLGPRKKP